MLIVMIIMLLSATGGTIYIFTLKYAIPYDNPKREIVKTMRLDSLTIQRAR